jgi:hypothetical protein
VGESALGRFVDRIADFDGRSSDPSKEKPAQRPELQKLSSRRCGLISITVMVTSTYGFEIKRHG